MGVAVAGKIFINYRRGDDPGFTQALYQRLEDEFTAVGLFKDVEGHIKPGDDFVEVLNDQVAQCDVLLVVIGPRWVELLAARAGAKDDFVAIEIGAALDKGKRVIPVLVGGASMPRAETLPEPIEALARRNAVGLRPERFRSDCQGLITALKEQLTAAEREQTGRTARIAAVESRAQAQRVAGLSPEEVRKAEERANWEVIKDSGVPSRLRGHLARFPDGVTALDAMAQLENLEWTGLGSSADGPSLQAFLDEFPKGANSDKAKALLADRQIQGTNAKAETVRRASEDETWATVASGTDATAIKAFLKAWPKGRYAAAAKARVVELQLRRRVLQGAGLVVIVAMAWWWLIK